MADTDDSEQQHQSSTPTKPSVQLPDRRHLKSIHKRVTGEDGLYETIIEPYRTPLLPLAPDPNPNPKSKPVSLKVVTVKAPIQDSAITKNGATTQQGPDSWQTGMNSKGPTAPVVRPAWADAQSTRPANSRAKPWDPTASEHPFLPVPTRTDIENIELKTLSVQEPATESVSTSKEPERFVQGPLQEAAELASSHPAVNQKKKAKQAREVKRKVKKLTEQDVLVDPTLAQDDDVADTVHTSNMGESLPCLATVEYADDTLHVDSLVRDPSNREALTSDLFLEDVGALQDLVSVSCEESLSVPLPTTKHRKHEHWVKFSRNFIPDQLTVPSMLVGAGCTDSISCAFESNNILDCPFHKPRKYASVNKFQKMR